MHEQTLDRVAALIEREHQLRRDSGEAGTLVTAQSLAQIVIGALVALEAGNVELAKTLLAAYLAQYADATLAVQSRESHDG